MRVTFGVGGGEGGPRPSTPRVLGTGDARRCGVMGDRAAALSAGEAARLSLYGSGSASVSDKNRTGR